jgi:hypothetical protein
MKLLIFLLFLSSAVYGQQPMFHAHNNLFIPSVINGCRLWLDASDSSTITKDGSNKVSQWNDKSIYGNNITQSTSANQPVFLSNTLNGLPVVSFGGSNVFMSSASGFGTNNSLSGPATMTVFYIYKKTISTNGGVFGWGLTANTLQAFGFYDDGSLSAYAYAGANNYYTSTPSTATWYLSLYKKAGAAVNTSSAFRNGVDVSTSGHSVSNSNINGTASFNLGRWSDYSSNTLNGYIAEVIIYNRSLSTVETTQVESYLKSKWGITY